MPTRCNRGFYCRSYCLLNMFRASLCPSSVNQHPANRTHNPQLHTRPATWKTTARNTTDSNHCIILLSSWWPLLHLAGILFPHINDDARSKLHPFVLFSCIRKTAISDNYHRHTSLSVCTHELDSHLTDFFEIWYIRRYRKCAEKIPVSLQSDKNNRYFTWRPLYIFGHISSSSS